MRGEDTVGEVVRLLAVREGGKKEMEGHQGRPGGVILTATRSPAGMAKAFLRLRV